MSDKLYAMLRVRSGPPRAATGLWRSAEGRCGSSLRE